jgi:ligand-binding sensor domain-containing protein
MQYDYRPIAVDGLGRIWMGYFERLTLKPDEQQYAWEQVSLPPEFVVTSDPDIRYLWASLGSIHTSSNGNLWFESTAGLIQYSAIQDQWCRITNSISIYKYKVAEDSNGNLWIAVNSGKYNGIYKYHLQP